MIGYTVMPPDPHLEELLALIVHRLLALEGIVKGMKE